MNYKFRHFLGGMLDICQLPNVPDVDARESVLIREAVKVANDESVPLLFALQNMLKYRSLGSAFFLVVVLLCFSSLVALSAKGVSMFVLVPLTVAPAATMYIVCRTLAGTKFDIYRDL